jgi:hypothetical protein
MELNLTQNVNQRFIIKVGKFGAYFYDTKLNKDLDLNHAKNLLNLYEITLNNYINVNKKYETLFKDYTIIIDLNSIQNSKIEELTKLVLTLNDTNNKLKNINEKLTHDLEEYSHPYTTEIYEAFCKEINNLRNEIKVLNTKLYMNIKFPEKKV